MKRTYKFQQTATVQESNVSRVQTDAERYLLYFPLIIKCNCLATRTFLTVLSINENVCLNESHIAAV